MFELNRIRLCNIGPRSARYNDVLLDFSGGGAPIPLTTIVPVPGQALRRPAPASLLMLVNGGGKSVLINTIISTVLPRRQSAAGRSALREFVLSNTAPSHVAIEWVEVGSGRTLITGQMLVRNGDKLERSFYSLRPNSEVTLTAMPFSEDGRWASFTAVRDSLIHLHGGAKELEYAEKSAQEDWESHLRGLGLEPDLFAVQQAMNIDEGDAADAFKRSSGKQFVQWFLERALDADQYSELTDAFTAYATNIGRHEQYRLEQAFSQAMETACGELATRHAEAGSVETALGTTGTTLAALSSSIDQALALATTRRDDLSGDLASARGLIKHHEDNLDQAELRTKEVKRRTLIMQRKTLEQEQDTANKRLEATEQEASAWETVPAVLELQAAEAHFTQITKVLEEAETTAAPARRDRDTAGSAYRAVLLAAQQQALSRATDLEKTIKAQEEKAAGLEEEAGDEEHAAGAATGEITQLKIQIRRAEEAVDTAHDEGLLLPEQDVASGLEHAQDQLGKTVADTKKAVTDRKEREDDAKELRDAAKDLEEPATEARSTARDKRSGLERHRATARAILSEPVTGELLEYNAVPETDPLTELDACADELATRIKASNNSTESRLRRLGIEALRDEHLLDALSVPEDGLLPPREAVEQILALLEGKVEAAPGWRWLAETVHPSRHRQTIQAHPDLLDGIIVANRELLDKARAIIDEARPLPMAAITVAVGDELHHDAEAENRFVIQPTPALHDPSAAEAELAQVQSRIAGRTATIAELEERRDALTGLAQQLKAWRSSVPAGSAESLITDVERLEAQAGKAQTELGKAQTEAEAAEQLAAAARSKLEKLTQQANDHQRTTDALSALVKLDAEAAAARGRVGELDQETARHRAQATKLRGGARAIRNANTERSAQIERATRDASSYAEKRSSVIGTDSGDHVTGEVDAAHLTSAQHVYEAAAETYAAVEVGADLHATAGKADERLKDAGAALTGTDPDVLAVAQRLTGEPAATDASARDAAKREQDRLCTSLRAKIKELDQLDGSLKERLTPLTQRTGLPWAELTEEWIPRDTEHGHALEQQAEAAVAAQTQTLATATTANGRMQDQLTQAAARVDGLDRVATRLRDALRGQTSTAVTAEPWSSTVEEAATQAAAAIDKLAEHKEAATRTREKQREAVHALRATLGDPRFDRLTTSIKTQISALNLDLIPPRAAEWTEGFRNRIAALSSDLDEADRNRNLLISQLHSYVNEALQVLAKAERVSTLPDSAGEWSGRQVLRIRFTKPDTATLQARIGDVLDEHARTGARASGLDLVLRGVTNAVSRDFNVDLLKPAMGSIEERVPVERMKEVFSGGQELTGGIMLYCTLAAIRMANRGRRGERYGGMLILDNPIGKANAEYLLELQMTMAKAVGVQLIYTTGSKEDRVLAAFPLRIQLRNDADQRTGTRYIHVNGRALGTPEQSPGLNGQRPGEITAVRLMDKAAPQP